jgi:hypothetical protein
VILIVALLFLLGFISSPLWLGYLPDSIVYYQEFREAQEIIKRIDEFNRAKSVLPTDPCVLGLRCDENAPIQYNSTEAGYMLSFSTPTHGLFSNLIYESVTGKWHAGES